MIASIAIHRKATIWHHNCEINAPESLYTGSFLQCVRITQSTLGVSEVGKVGIALANPFAKKKSKRPVKIVAQGGCKHSMLDMWLIHHFKKIGWGFTHEHVQ
ncbi:MAG: hypothetical protein WD425_15765 [Nitrospirales bacterium]